MKKIFCWILAFPLLVEAQTATGPGFQITGNLTGLSDQSVVSLTDANNPKDTLVKTLAKDGHFVLTGHLPQPNIFELNLVGAKKKTILFIGNDKVDISGSVGDLKELTVKGSPSQDDFMEFQKIFNPYIMQLNAINQLANSPQGAAKGDSISKAYAEVVSAVQMAQDHFLENKKSSYVSPFMLIVLSQLSDDVMLLDKRLHSLSPEVQNSFFGKYLQDQVANLKIGAVGSDAMDFTQNDTTGKPVTLSSFKGKYVLVDFWASWCKPCRMENPNVVAAFKKFKTKNFAVLSVSLDKARDPWIEAIKQDNLTWTHVSDLKYWNNDVAVKYKIQSIPQNFLVDPNGKIVAKNLHGAELEAKLCELIGCN